MNIDIYSNYKVKYNYYGAEIDEENSTYEDITFKRFNYETSIIENGAYISIAQYIWLLERQIKKQKEAIDKAIEFSNKNWGTWCTHHIEYMTELQNILKEVSE